MKRSIWFSLKFCVSALVWLLAARTLASDPAGQVLFNTRVSGTVDAKVSRPDGTGAGSGAKAQLLLVGDGGVLTPLLPVTTFRNDIPAEAFYVDPVTVDVPTKSPGQQALLRMRAWIGADYGTATSRGESADFIVTLGGGLLPPSDLGGLSGFSLAGDVPNPSTVDVIAAAGANGSVTPSGTTTKSKGSTFNFSATPKSGFTVDKWSVNGASIQTGGNSFSLPNVQQNCSVLVTFKQEIVSSVLITGMAGSHGSISPGGAFLKTKGSGQTFNAAAGAGYEVDKWSVNGEATQSGGTTFTLSNIQSSRTVLVTFKQSIASTFGKVSFTTHVGAFVDAKVNRPDGTGAGDGAKAQLFLVANDGKLTGLLPITTFRTTSPEAAFYVNPVDVTAAGVMPGQTAKFRMRAWIGESFAGSNQRGESKDIMITLGGGLLPPADLVGLEGFSLGAPVPEPGKFIVTASEGANGLINPNGSVAKAAGESQTFTAIPKSGYAVDQWILDGSTVQTGGKNYTLSGIQANHAVGVSFRQIGASGAGSIFFNNHIVGQVEAKVSRPDGTGAGAGAKAQLVLVKQNGDLQALLPLAAFRTSSAEAAFYVDEEEVIVPGALPGQTVVVRMLAWIGDSFDSAKLRGNSKDITIVLGGGLLPPPNLVGLEGFVLSTPALGSVPLIVEQPKSANAHLGSTAFFSVKTAGNGPFKYQWKHNGNPIGGATSQSLKIKPVKASDAGDYMVTISNSTGSSTSSKAVLEVTKRKSSQNFDDDEGSDILLINKDRSIAFWFMDGVKIRSGHVPFKLPEGWKVAGTGDFNKDGKTDLLLLGEDRSLAFWLMDGTTIQQGLVPMHLPEGWHIAAVGDFNNDDQTDILLRSETGKLAFWLMNGTSVEHTLDAEFELADGWKIVGVGDFNKDGETDILLSHGNRTLAFWFMEGTSLKKGLVPLRLPEGWEIVGLGDFNHDGQTDLLLRGKGNWLAFWLMDGVNIESGQIFAQQPDGWQVIQEN
ncbi:MAG: hypothetical protein EXS30_07555 [Pedosphaera sp.]|nr:hypothetical protein [Pedosphaera sp.]